MIQNLQWIIVGRMVTGCQGTGSGSLSQAGLPPQGRVADYPPHSRSPEKTQDGELKPDFGATARPRHALMEDDIRQLLAAQQYREAFELLLTRFKDKVFRLSFSMLRDETHAEDTTQEIFLRIWKGLPGYHGEASLSTWVYTISRNTCLTELKKRAARPTISLSDPSLEDSLDALPALQTSDRESGAEMDVQAMLAQLPDKYRRVVTLFYLEQKAYEEVAAMLGIPLGTVKTLLFRAKKELLKIAVRHPVVLAQI